MESYGAASLLHDRRSGHEELILRMVTAVVLDEDFDLIAATGLPLTFRAIVAAGYKAEDPLKLRFVLNWTRVQTVPMCSWARKTLGGMVHTPPWRCSRGLRPRLHHRYEGGEVAAVRCRR